jgi:hypothetical protein
MDTLKKARKIVFICFTSLLGIALIHSKLGAISLYARRITTSFPWWSAYFFGGILYSIPLGLLLIAAVILSLLIIRERSTTAS